MIASLLALLGLTGAFAAVGPVIAHRIHPAVAVWLLVPASLLIAAASTFALGVAAFTLIGQWSEIAEMGPWSPATLRQDTPVPATAAVVGALLLAYATVSTTILVSRRSVALVEVHRRCGRLGAPGSLIIIESDTPDAFTTPELTGRIIVTRGMLDALTPPQRRAMLAHEASHLRHRHTWWLLAADLAAAINPTLRPITRALRHAVERWADEDAATELADRRTVAHAVAHAALAAHEHRCRPSIVAAATGGDVPARVAALLTPRRLGIGPVLVAIAVSLALLAGTADASFAVQRNGEALFQHVMQTDAGTHSIAPAIAIPAAGGRYGSGHR